jgi:ATP-dependent helicase YprA (DUF1998 family)
MVTSALGPAAPSVDVYDGDTPSTDRAAIRERAQLLITNPDMLHVSVLPFHRTFQKFLSGLRYVVVDEGHMYKGAFGCHAACVFRRLRRICERECGRSPTFAVASATSADPARHVRDLLGVRDVVVVDEDGSPHGPRMFVMWNPPELVPWASALENTRIIGAAAGEGLAGSGNEHLQADGDANPENAGVCGDRPGKRSKLPRWQLKEDGSGGASAAGARLL